MFPQISYDSMPAEPQEKGVSDGGSTKIKFQIPIIKFQIITKSQSPITKGRNIDEEKHMIWKYWGIW